MHNFLKLFLSEKSRKINGLSHAVPHTRTHSTIAFRVRRVKYELHKSGNDHSPILIPSTFQWGWLAPDARTQATRLPLLICHWNKQDKWPCGVKTIDWACVYIQSRQEGKTHIILHTHACTHVQGHMRAHMCTHTHRHTCVNRFTCTWTMNQIYNSTVTMTIHDSVDHLHYFI